MKLQSSLASRPAPRADHRVLQLMAGLTLGALLCACGQKGPLTLPKPPANAASAAPSK